MASLALLASLLDALVGEAGLLAQRIPDPELLASLRALVLAQHAFLLVGAGEGHARRARCVLS